MIGQGKRDCHRKIEHLAWEWIDVVSCAELIIVSAGGFFYLNLMDTDEGEDLEQESEQILDLTKQLFGLSLEDKKKYMMEMGGSLAG